MQAVLERWLWRVFELAAAVLGTPADREVAEERRLIAAARRRGPKGERAYEQLITQHQAWLINFLTALLSSRPDAEDIAQEVLLKAYLALDRFRGEARFRTWIRRIATNEAFNSRRKKRESLTATGDLPDLGYDDSAIGSFAAREALIKVLDALPYSYREALVLRHVEALDVKAIARALDVGEGAAKMRLKRARDRFREIYQGMVEGP